MINTANIRKTLYYLKRNGFRETWYAVKERGLQAKGEAYRFSPVSDDELKRQRVWAEGLSQDERIRISIVVPAYRTPRAYLEALLDSVFSQSYPFFELIIADATEDDSVKCVAEAYLKRLSAEEKAKLRLLSLAKNMGISANTNEGIGAVSGAYTGLLDHDDLLTKDALYEMANAVISSKNPPDMLYSDEDKCDEDGESFYEPNIKPDFDYELLLSNNYICHFTLIRTDIIKRLLLRTEFDGAQDYDLFLRAVKECGGNVHHIPLVLYHWRCHRASTSENPGSKNYAYEAGRRALQAHADSSGYAAEVLDTKHVGFYTLRYKKDIFVARKDIGAVGGRITDGRRVVGGALNHLGKPLYGGLDIHFGGYLHRAELAQEVYALDGRCIRVRPELREDFCRIFGLSEYRERKNGFAEITDEASADEEYIRKSLDFGGFLIEKGYRSVYCPEYTLKLSGKAGKKIK
ncbi:MAG: glycosyltransferase [Lachnospiraceae bacterium]|nr:glycosyltransferase [Lachnospiraceae bacterium]